MLSPDNLHPYQKRASKFIIDRKKAALWIGLGLGKTVITLSALEELINSFEVGKVLIIAPLRVARSVWAQEAAKWSHTRGLTCSHVLGPEKERIKALMRTADIYIINRENIVWLLKTYFKNKPGKWPFDCVIIDESSSFKSSSAKRWRALKRVSPYISRMVQLTGTPSPNGLLDLWPQMFLLDGGYRLGPTKTNFINRYFESDFMGYNYTPKSWAPDKIYQKLEDITLSLRTEDWIEMPERFDSVIKIQLPEKVKKLYSDFEKQFLIELENETVEALNAAALANKLLQICNGAIYTDEKKNWKELHTEKLDALQDIIDDNPGENILVAYNYKTDLIRLKKKFKTAKTLDSDNTILDWNEGKIPLLLAHPASAGHGLNLQSGGRIIVWFGLNWSLELYEQFCGRLHRQGQEKPVKVVHLVADNCIDERVINAIAGKAKTQNDLINALREQNYVNR